MEKEREEALRWFVDFANMNLETIKRGDKAKLLVESQEYLFPTREVDMFALSPKYSSLPISVSPEDEAAGFRADLTRIMGDMVWAFKDSLAPDSEEYWSKLPDLQRSVKGNLNFYLESSSAMIISKVDMMVEAGWDNDRFEVIQLPITKDQEQYIQFKLHQLMNGLPASTIQRCPGCMKYFFNPSRRKKRFCSPRCMWKVNTAKRREADRDGYNKYQSMLKKDLLREKKGLPRKKTKSRKAKKGE